jgi:hypothetical protein
VASVNDTSGGTAEPAPVTEWDFEVVVPEAWLPLDSTGTRADHRGALVRDVEQAAARMGAANAAAVLLDMASQVAADADERGALAAAVGFDLVGDNVAVSSMMALRLEGDRPADPEHLATLLAAPRPEDLRQREVEVVALPVGPAVRVHAIADLPGDDEDAPSVVVEGLDHFIPVPGGNDVLLVSCTTPMVALGDALLPTFDAIAASVTIEPAPGPQG